MQVLKCNRFYLYIVDSISDDQGEQRIDVAHIYSDARLLQEGAKHLNTLRTRQNRTLKNDSIHFIKIAMCVSRHILTSISLLSCSKCALLQMYVLLFFVRFSPHSLPAKFKSFYFYALVVNFRNCTSHHCRYLNIDKL